ncbi:hypothetical protein FN846DRAFT_630903 [Sphaerosporella brunnea]|uniref:Uncharacterized protein n=1 Tax=Sphaerosporella brunnea TaxID=1250544 RepID=A0A5J5F1U6_9PEZI|nr:hypothetical protein FN846DRAFT_630903 [Sphaerosporella brunnea]
MECGSIKDQCFDRGTNTASSTISSTPTTSITSAAAASGTIESSAAASTQPQPLTKVESFFSTKVIIIFSVCGGTILLLIGLVSCFCYHRRKQGQLALQAYDDPERKPYQSIVFEPRMAPPLPRATSPQPLNSYVQQPEIIPAPCAASATHLRNPFSPQANYFDLYSPDSPAFQMVSPSEAGPLEQGGFYYPSGEYHYSQNQELQESEKTELHLSYPYPPLVGYPDQEDDRKSDAGSGIYAASDIYAAYEPQSHTETEPLSPTQENPAELPPKAQTPQRGSRYSQHQQLPVRQSWPRHRRTLTPPQQQFLSLKPASPPRPPRGPDVYLPDELSKQYLSKLPRPM